MLLNSAFSSPSIRISEKIVFLEQYSDYHTLFKNSKLYFIIWSKCLVSLGWYLSLRVLPSPAVPCVSVQMWTWFPPLTLLFTTFFLCFIFVYSSYYFLSLYFLIFWFLTPSTLEYKLHENKDFVLSTAESPASAQWVFLDWTKWSP